MAKKATSKKSADSKNAAENKSSKSKTDTAAKKAPAKSGGNKPAGASGNGDTKKLSPFVRKQRERLLELRDELLDSMNGVAKGTLRSRAEDSESHTFGMHQADAGSDAYDRDFALNLLSQEQDALYEIDAALERIEEGTYGVCEMSGEKIPQARLQAIPFARFTVDCQAQIERENSGLRQRHVSTSLFGLTETESGSSEDES